MKLTAPPFPTIAVLILSLFFSINPLSAQTSLKAQTLTLSEAVETALKNNPRLDSMVRAVLQAEYLHAAAVKDRLPVLSTQYAFAGFAKRPELRFSSGEIEELDIRGEELSFPLSERSSFAWSTHVKMPLYTGFALEAQQSIAHLGISVSEWKLLEAKADLIQEVTLNYLSVLRAEDYLEVAAQNLARFRRHERITSKFYKVGLTAKNTLLEIQVRRANAQQDLIVAKKNVKLTKAVLNVGMGVDVDASYRLEKIPPIRQTGLSLPESARLAKAHNPTLVAFTYLKERAEKVVELEKTQGRPKVSFDLSFTRHGKTAEVNGGDHLSNNIFAAMIVGDWEVFDWFKTKDRAQARRKDLEILLNDHKRAEDQVSLDIRESFLSLESARHKLKAAEQEIQYAQENYRITRQRYEEQVAPSTEVNDALVLLKQAHFNHTGALYEYHTALAKLERITGTNLKRRGE